MKTEQGIIEEFQIKKGVSLFNLYTEKISREIEDMEGMNVWGHNINNLRYSKQVLLYF